LPLDGSGKTSKTSSPRALAEQSTSTVRTGWGSVVPKQQFRNSLSVWVYQFHVPVPSYLQSDCDLFLGKVSDGEYSYFGQHLTSYGNVTLSASHPHLVCPTMLLCLSCGRVNGLICIRTRYDASSDLLHQCQLIVSLNPTCLVVFVTMAAIRIGKWGSLFHEEPLVCGAYQKVQMRIGT
jgi:hypothetical protein